MLLLVLAGGCNQSSCEEGEMCIRGDVLFEHIATTILSANKFLIVVHT